MSSDSTKYGRGDRVVCRTPRGVEIGEVVTLAEKRQATTDRMLLRVMTPEDIFLWDRLQKYRKDAVHRCREELATHAPHTTLLEVEQLLDGKTLIFHFLGPIDDSVQKRMDLLAERYEEKVRTRQFAKLLEKGCGPGCGTSAAKTCGSCAVCVVASACTAKAIE